MVEIQGKVKGFSPDTPNNYLINNAVLYTDVSFNTESGKWEGTRHGATSGGVSINYEPEVRNIEVDGMNKIGVVGNQVIDSVTITATANVKEILASTISHAMNASIDTEGEQVPNYDKYTSSYDLSASSYHKNLAVFGNLSNGKYVIAILDNAKNLAGMELGTEDNSESVIETTYTAHATIEQLENDEVPFRMYLPTEAASPEQPVDPETDGTDPATEV